MIAESAPGRFDAVDVDLRNAGWAAVLAWLWPGAGHIYQGRYGKGLLYMSCILVIYFWGLAMGEGHVVYASFRPNDMRYQFLLQAAVGLPAMPAVLQRLAGNIQPPLFGGLMAPPQGPVEEQIHDQKAAWHDQSGFYFELGTLFTMVAGLLNILAIYDAHAGPVFGPPNAGGEAGNAEAGDAAASRPEFGAGMHWIGMAIGLIVALNLRSLWEIDGRWVTYLFAAAGLVVGWALSRIVFGLVAAVFPRRNGA